RTPGNECVKVVCGLRAATILQTVLAPTELATLRRVDTPKPNTDSMNFQGIAINDAGLTNEIIGQRAARQQEEHQYQCSALDHELVTCGYRTLRGLNFGQFSSGFSDGRFSGRSG